MVNSCEPRQLMRGGKKIRLAQQEVIGGILGALSHLNRGRVDLLISSCMTHRLCVDLGDQTRHPRKLT